jgi:hypothetical protein
MVVEAAVRADGCKLALRASRGASAGNAIDRRSATQAARFRRRGKHDVAVVLVGMSVQDEASDLPSGSTFDLPPIAFLDTGAHFVSVVAGQRASLDEDRIVPAITRLTMIVTLPQDYRCVHVVEYAIAGPVARIGEIDTRCLRERDLALRQSVHTPTNYRENPCRYQRPQQEADPIPQAVRRLKPLWTLHGAIIDRLTSQLKTSRKTNERVCRECASDEGGQCEAFRSWRTALLPIDPPDNAALDPALTPLEPTRGFPRGDAGTRTPDPFIARVGPNGG